MNKIYAHLHQVETFTKFLLCKPCVFSDRRHRIVYVVKGLLIFNGIGGAFFFPLSYISDFFIGVYIACRTNVFVFRQKSGKTHFTHR